MESRIEERVEELRRGVARKEKWMAEDAKALREVEFKEMRDILWAEEHLRKIREAIEEIEKAKVVIDELERL